MPRPRRWLPLVVLLVVAALLRLWDLELRPPHHDEGVNGWFTERTLHDGYYTYDPANYHGPAYFYLLAASRWLFGFGLWQLRLPGALLGVGLCAVPLLARSRLGSTRALVACGLLALSPTLIYYARYAIHETLLAGLTLVVAASVLRWADSGRARWLVLAAAALAAMVATKETTIVFLGVSGVWLVGEAAVGSVRARRLEVLGRPLTWSWRATGVAALMLAIMAVIHVALFTGGLRQPGGTGELLRRSLRAYMVWTKTGTGHGGHVKDTCYYLHLGVRYDLALYALAIAGLVTGWRERWVRGPALVGFGMCAAYSAVAYKMPWLPMSWLVLLALPAAHGVVALGRVLTREVSPRLGVRAAAVLAAVPALVIAVRSSFLHPADHREALAYVHTDADYNRWFPLIEAGARAVGPARFVVAVEHDWQWPLAWSLTPYKQARWSATGDEDVLIVAPSRLATVEAKLRDSYLRREYRVRDSSEPAVLFLRRDLYAPILAARHLTGQFTLVAPAAAAPSMAMGH